MPSPEPAESAHVDDEPQDLLELDSEGVSPRALARLGLLALAVAAATLGISILLGSVAGGSALDFVIFVAWLAAALLFMAGSLLLAAAGVAALINRTRATGPSATRTTP